MQSEPQSRTTPAELVKLLQSRPLLSIGGRDQSCALVQHYRHQPGPSNLTVSPLRDHLLVVNLGGQILIEDFRSVGRWERRWAGSGQMSLMPAGTSATRKFRGHSEALLIHLPAQLVLQIASESGLPDATARLVPRLAVTDEVVGQLGKLILATASSQEIGTAAMLDALIRALVIHLVRHHSTVSADHEAAPGSLSGGRLQGVITYMQAHLDHQLPLSSLVSMSGLSPSQFARTFRAIVGKPPHAYLLELRIHRARELLESTKLPVIEVGLQCGFSQPTHFATMFKKAVGLSPREWRDARQ